MEILEKRLHSLVPTLEDLIPALVCDSTAHGTQRLESCFTV